MVKDRILIVDDEKDSLELLGDCIASFGFDYDKAEDGAQAIDKLQSEIFTIVLTDIVMPNLDGMQLLKYIREFYPKLGVIVITGGPKYSYTDVIKAGASDFIAKPFDINELEAKLNRLVRELNMINQLQQHSMHDALTELYNRRYFDSNILTELRRAERQGHEVYMHMLDVDNLKGYNDNNGHQGGDKLLQELSAILFQSIRENVDWAFRYGGDEFGIISIQVDLPQVKRMAERILRKYKQAQFTGTGLSIGIARFIRHPGKTWEQDLRDFVARSDAALYAAKMQGKNKIVVSKGGR